MEWITCLKTVLARIEADLEQDLTIEALAAEVNLSPYYLQQGFQILTGYGIGEYVRCRRLYEAARILVNSDEKVIDVAYRFGYETPESFTKAFTRFHGVSPTALRKDRSRMRRFLPLQISIEITGGNKMDYRIELLRDFAVVGFQREFSYEKPYEEIPKFWDELTACYPALGGARSETPDEMEKAILRWRIGEFAACIDDLGNGKFRYLVAGKYDGGEVPEGLTVYRFPDGEWAKFRSVGPIPDALQSLNTQVFKEWLPGNAEFQLAEPYNLEWYGMGDPASASYESGIWVPVRRWKQEAKERWGDTEAYRESEKRTSKRTKQENAQVSEGLMAIFARFGSLKNEAPDSAAAQALARELQDYISQNYYPCTNDIFAGLGEMYVSDERFRENIDRRGGAGTAAFAGEAIRIFCKK